MTTLKVKDICGGSEAFPRQSPVGRTVPLINLKTFFLFVCFVIERSQDKDKG